MGAHIPTTSSSSGVDHEDVYDNLSPVEDPFAVASSTSTYRTHGLLCVIGKHAVSVYTDNILRSSISLQTGPYWHKQHTVVQWLVSHKNLYPMATVSRGNKPVGYALSLLRTCTTACSSELRQFTEPHSLLMDSLQLWSDQMAEMRPITTFCYFRTATSTTGTATPHSHCPRCRLPRHRPHYNAAVVSSSCVCEVCCWGRMTLMCDHGDDVNSSNACGMPSVTMVLSVSPPAHNHHSLSFGGNHNSGYAILGHFRSM